MSIVKVRSRFALGAGLCLALCQQAYGRWKGPPDFTGTDQMPVTVNASYGTMYKARTFNPTLQIALSARGRNPAERNVSIKDDQYAVKYKCDLIADIKNNELVFKKNQTCDLAIETPDFCLLAPARCKDRVQSLQCSQEKAAGHLGILTGTLLEGAMSRDRKGAWSLFAKYSVDGCVLAHGYNKNAPISVRGAALIVEHK